MTDLLRCELCDRLVERSDPAGVLLTTCPQAFTFGKHIWKPAAMPVDLGWVVSAAELDVDAAKAIGNVIDAELAALAEKLSRQLGVDIHASRMAR